MTSPRFLRHAWMFALLLAASVPGRAFAEVLPDSTVSDGWKLANGLEVRVRHVPGAVGVSISVGYRAGKLYEPARREGLAALLAELINSAPAGEVPERSREEMNSLRPFGWGVQTNDHVVVITENAAVPQFPGVLRQVATRMRGVRPTKADLDAALAVVRADLGARRFGRPDLALYYRSRDLAFGSTDEQILHRAAGRDLDGLTVDEAVAELRRLYVPANACLSIAGNLENIDVRAIVEHEFGAIAGGTAQPELPSPSLTPFERALSFAGLGRPISAMGIIAPAVEDTLHPSFYLGMVLCGPFISSKLGAPLSPLTRRFQYSLFDEPDLVRFYLEPAAGDREPATVRAQFESLVDQLAEAVLERDAFESVRRSLVWLLGGDLLPSVREQMKRQPAALGTLSSGMATRALWKGDEFWSVYRKRFETTTVGHSAFRPWLTDPKHQGVLLLLPKP